MGEVVLSLEHPQLSFGEKEDLGDIGLFAMYGAIREEAPNLFPEGAIPDEEEVWISEGRSASVPDVVGAMVYKKVALRVKPLLTDLPEEFRIVRRSHPDPLGGMPELPEKAPEFREGKRFTRERYEKMKEEIEEERFLWDEEIALALELVRLVEMGFAWD